MKDQLSATIIPFPVRSRPVADLPAEASPAAAAPVPQSTVPTHRQASELTQSSQRLTAALANLSAALADQKDATMRWKAAIEDLSAKMRVLGDIEFGKKKIS